MPLELASRAFQQGGDIPKRYTCDGDNISAPFIWSGVPHGTRTCDDTDTAPWIFHPWGHSIFRQTLDGSKRAIGPKVSQTAFGTPSMASESPGTAARGRRAAAAHIIIISAGVP